LPPPAHNPRMLELRSPLQAQVVQWLVAPGDTVREGDVVVILEAMKMEHRIAAPSAGTVAELNVAAGQQVESGAVLAVIE